MCDLFVFCKVKKCYVDLELCNILGFWMLNVGEYNYLGLCINIKGIIGMV